MDKGTGQLLHLVILESKQTKITEDLSLMAIKASFTSLLYSSLQFLWLNTLDFQNNEAVFADLDLELR